MGRSSFDPHKDALNRRLHGISLAEAERFEFDTALVEEDRDMRHEERWRAIGFIGDRLHFLVFAETDDGPRFISLRLATAAERRRYANQI